ncbi:MAG: hypothetical protein H0T42_32320 [Deltaproteobacteria bacterium]|nr:hypothetical protein [Deltaproteobacteria bacterium]
MRSIALAASLLAACSDDPDQQLVDASTTDAPYDTARCLITGHYGALGAKTGMPTLGPTTLSVVLDAGPPRDTFFLKLTTGNGVFAGGLANGTYPLAGADLDFNSCGLCVNIIADIGAMGPTKFYFADAGSVTLTSTQPPAGSLANVTFKEVTSGGAPVAGGCVASIASLTFD